MKKLKHRHLYRCTH